MSLLGGDRVELPERERPHRHRDATVRRGGRRRLGQWVQWILLSVGLGGLGITHRSGKERLLGVVTVLARVILGGCRLRAVGLVDVE
jgi:hypothetical protein